MKFRRATNIPETAPGVRLVWVHIWGYQAGAGAWWGALSAPQARIWLKTTIAGYIPKLITLAEELRRRLLNMDRSHTWEEQRQVIDDFLQKMCDSGYGESTRMEVIKSAITKYHRQLMEQDSGGRRIYRSAEEMASGRRLKGLLNQTWFRSKRGGTKITSAKDLPWRLQSVED